MVAPEPSPTFDRLVTNDSATIRRAPIATTLGAVSTPADRPPTEGPASAFGEGAPPTRQRRSAQTRERILDAAHELFVDEGIASVSLRDVAARAGLTHPGVLRHFGSPAALLGAVVERLDRANADWIDHETGADDRLGFVALARRNAATPGYLELYTALSGEATSADHPAHAHLRDRYERVREAITRSIADAGAVAGLDARTRATLLMAGWDGLQLQQRYDADAVDLIGQLERHEQRLLGRPTPVEAADFAGERVRLSPTVVVEPTPADELANPRRAAIVSSAMELFARGGFHGTSLRTIADHVGIAKATLIHHIGSKDELLTEVLRRRDRLTITDDAPPDAPAADRLAGLTDVADRTAREEPGLVELYAVLSCEAATPGHPAHAYFARRFRQSRRYFLSLLLAAFDEGALAPGRSPRDEAAWLLAVWDGLQIQWLYDPSIEVGAHLRAHLGELLAGARE